MATRSNVDLVLINPAGRKRIYQSLSTDLSAIETPVWAGLMATFALGKGLSVEIIDANALNLDAAETAAEVALRKPVLAAVIAYGQQPSASTQVMPGASAVVNAIKEHSPDIKVMLAGGHVAALPEMTMQQEKADFVASGEGVHTIVELIAALKANSTDFSKVHGLLYRDNGVIRTGAPAGLVENLDRDMPGIAWEMIDLPKYRAHNWHTFGGIPRQPYAALYTTLGCPYKCTFCCIQAPFKDGEKVAGKKEEFNSYRYWSLQSVMKQLDYLAAHGVQNLKFADEMFVLNPKHVMGICDAIIERGHKFNIWAYARVDTVQDKLLEKLKRAGVNWLAFGIEAANATVRDDVQKGFDQEDIAKTIAKVRAAGIYVIANYIFGLPEDNVSTMQETLKMATDLNCEFANFYCTMAYPGSQLYKEAIKNNWPLPETWSGFSQHSVDMLPLPTKHLSAGEVITFRDKAFQTYFSHPPYLEMVAQKFGNETAQHIREMAAHKLERRFAK